jgi:putative endopeptidase
MRHVIASLLVVAAACSSHSRAPASVAPVGSSAVPPATSAAPTPTSRAGVKQLSLAEVGLEPASLDKTSDPCVDFYQFACGGWVASSQIPEDRARWARFSEIDERNKAAIRSLLEEDTKGSGADATAKTLGDFYASCMDEAGIEKTGTTSIKALLDKTQKVKDAKSWLIALTELHKLGISVVWQAGASADLKNSTTNVTQLDSAGLGLPDRDYYVKADFKDKVEAYKLHVGKMLALLGTPQAKAEADAADVIAIETELAKLTKTGVEKRDPTAAYNPTDLKGLA